MGLTVLTVDVGNPANPGVTRPIEFLIDSGAIYSVVPRSVLEELGITPIAQHEFRLADGTTIRREKGGALFRYGDRVGGGDVIFGEEHDVNLLGALTLGSLGLTLDPLRRKLKPLPMVLGGWQPAFDLGKMNREGSGVPRGPSDQYFHAPPTNPPAPRFRPAPTAKSSAL